MLNDKEKERAAVAIQTLSEDTKEEMIMISMISPYNQTPNKLSEAGRQNLRGRLELRMARMEAEVMTGTNPEMIKASQIVADLCRVAYNILEAVDGYNDLDQDIQRKDLAKADDDFMKFLEKLPLIKLMLLFMLDEVARMKI